MLIVGAKGFAKEVLEVLHQCNKIDQIAFYDDINKDIPDTLYDEFPVIKSSEDARLFFELKNDRFTIGIGNPVLRKNMYEKFVRLGGKFTSVISPFANIGKYGNNIGIGCNIMTGVVITNDITIHRGALINLNCTIGHDVNLGEFIELSPGVHISGNCSVGDYCSIGTNASLLPKVEIGSNVIIGAGAVVTQNIPDNSLAVGVPAKVIKSLNPLNFNE